MSAPRRPELRDVVVGLDGPSVLVSPRVAEVLARRLDLERLRRDLDAIDPEAGTTIAALLLAARGSRRHGSDGGTSLGGSPEPAAGSSVWLSSTGVASALGMSDRAVRKACAEGRLPAQVDQDGRWRIHRTDLEQYRLDRDRR